MNPTYSAEGLGWRYHNPDRLIDGRGRDITEAAMIPFDQPLTRILPTIGRWSSISGMAASATPFPFSLCGGTGVLAADASVASP